MASHRTWFFLAPTAAWVLVAACGSDEDRPAGLPGTPDAHVASDGGTDAPDQGAPPSPCADHWDCPLGQYCVNDICVVEPPPIDCPQDTVSVANLFCVDRFEASRPDATASTAGHENGPARSRKGVLPWQVASNQEAESACGKAGKRLCTPSEWQLACEGPARTVYGYGDAYDPQRCNGIDTFKPFHVAETGVLPDCRSGWGAYDLNGNLWEHVRGGDASTIRGGAYNCADSQKLHRCDYIPGSWTPTARGFRCCSDAGEVVDASVTPDAETDAETDVVHDVGVDIEVGCIDLDASDAMEDAATDTIDADEFDGWIEADGPLDAFVDAPPEAGEDAAKDVSSEDATSDVSEDTTADVSSEDATSDVSEDTTADVSSEDVTSDVSQDAVWDVVEEESGIEHCPSDMVLLGSFCIDRYEASHEDATASSFGTSPVASSRPGVMPWVNVNLAAARQACSLAGKHLCKPGEWVFACGGYLATAYAYGNDYDAAICNGIDAYCYCGSVACEALTDCPYPHCYNQASSEGGGPCGAYFHLVATGSFADCRNPWGVYDLNGNVWELVDTTDGLEHFRGGAYNCGDSVALHRCDYDATWGPTARGFRCCKPPM